MTIPSWAVRGAKVVCVGRKRKAHEPSVINDQGFRWKPAIGSHYTIRGTHENEWGWFIFLSEEPENHMFHGEGFRPVTLITQQDDIEAHFKALLDVPEQVGV